MQGWAQKPLTDTTSLDWTLRGTQFQSRITCPVVEACWDSPRLGLKSGSQRIEPLVLLVLSCLWRSYAMPQPPYLSTIWLFADIEWLDRISKPFLLLYYFNTSLSSLQVLGTLGNNVFLYFSYISLLLYKLNIVDGDAFLNLAIVIAPPIVLYRLIPVEYLQLWRGLFAGITLLDREALLLCVKVGGQGTILRIGCYAPMSQSPPQSQSQMNCSKVICWVQYIVC